MTTLALMLVLATQPLTPLADDAATPTPTSGATATAPSAASRADRYDFGLMAGQTAAATGALALVGGAVVLVESLALLGGVFASMWGSFITSSDTRDWVNAVGGLGIAMLAINTAVFPLLGAWVVNAIGDRYGGDWTWRFAPPYVAGLVAAAVMTGATVGLFAANLPAPGLVVFLATPLTMAVVQTWAANAFKEERTAAGHDGAPVQSPNVAPTPMLLLAPRTGDFAGAGVGLSGRF